MAAALPGAVARADARQARRRPMIDTLSISGPDFDAARMLAAGMTGLVLDLPIYPRTRQAALDALTRWAAAFAAPDTRFQLVRHGADFEAASATRRLAVVLACQDASILDAPSRSVGDVNLVNLRVFHALGLRILQLAHNDRNGVGDSYQEPNDAGLSRLGRDVVAEMNELGMVVDLSHCSGGTLREAVRLSSKPCMVTHSGCRALYPTLRNKADAEIRALAEKGGFFGVYSMTLWLSDEPTASVDQVVRHIDHAVKVAGVEHVGFASDGPPLGVGSMENELAGMQAYARRTLGGPGSERVPTHIRPRELNGPDRVAVLGEALRKKGYSATDVDRILGGNFERVFAESVG